MRAGAKRHIGRDDDRNAVLCQSRVHPGWQNDQVTSNLERLVVGFPCFHPVLIDNELVFNRSERGNLGHMPDRLLKLLADCFSLFILRKIGHNLHIARRDLLVTKGIILGDAVHHDPVGGKPREHLGHGFG